MDAIPEANPITNPSPSPMNAGRIAPLALYQEVAERLRQRIFAHELPPGTWVDEQALAAAYGISRTPLREALKVLAAEGLVTLKPRRGCYVTEISERDLDEILPCSRCSKASAPSIPRARQLTRIWRASWSGTAAGSSRSTNSPTRET